MAATRWNVANLLSLSRVPLVAPALVLLWRGQYRALALALLVAAWLTDVLDGWLARRLGLVTDFGKVVDPLADKVAIAAAGVVLVWKYGVPWWLFAAVVARDVAIVASAWWIIRARRRVPMSEFWGKAAALAMVAYGLAVIVDATGLPARVLAWAVAALVAASSVAYALVLARALKAKPPADA